MTGIGVKRANRQGIESEFVAAELIEWLAGLPKHVMGLVGSVDFKGDGWCGRVGGKSVRGEESDLGDGSVLDDEAFEPRRIGGIYGGWFGLRKLGQERAKGGKEFEFYLPGQIERVNMEETGFRSERESESEFGKIEA